MINLIIEFVSLAFSDPILFLSTYKFQFLMYFLNIIFGLYLTRNRCFSERVYFVSRNLFVMVLAQVVKLIAYYLNKR